jgi:hypothetical protein
MRAFPLRGMSRLALRMRKYYRKASSLLTKGDDPPNAPVLATGMPSPAARPSATVTGSEPQSVTNQGTPAITTLYRHHLARLLVGIALLLVFLAGPKCVCEATICGP